MKILIINAGSSSLKYQFMESEGGEVFAKGLCERIGIDGRLTHKVPGREDVKKDIPMPTHSEAIQAVLDIMVDPQQGVIASTGEIAAVGHRVLHGGMAFTESCIIDDACIAAIKECIPLGPLHNPANVTGIEAVTSILPDVPQVAVFDTAFHQTMPAKAYMYALPYAAYEKYGVRRYGFHGTSHRYVSARACEFLGLPYDKQRIITCHIGNGASITAIADGKSVDTSMGLTPTEGLMMGTRVGDVDPGAIVYMMEREGLDAAGVSNLINKRSGVAGISEISSDMRDIDAAISQGDRKAILALDMYEYRILKYIGAYAAVLGGVDVIVFTGGVGENQTNSRERICKQLAFMGVTFDAKANEKRGEEVEISGKDSSVHVVVIPTDEELMIAQDTAEIVSKL